ncbi:phosphate signaling complex PhoU family protein [Halopenitus persicus]|uniref:Phosphate uptake regulator n=1 Tax=Halopenitus persicus TaxID=1048396 RepID=A0A1H3JN47_9EURY|nr:phosphate uptake regulator PhoU [Halopenitus persicus]QHS15807.1 phosphate uptake regulator PhoU [haloarchaeon 3A1-DGR]SDY41346.1 Phosphate uptake regulator [Halopenitus persicus]
METRKVQRLGPSTLAMTLPAEWASEHDVDKGDEVSIRMGGTGTLTVLPESANTEESEATIYADDLDSGAVERAIVAQYVLGRRVIHVESDGPLGSDHINAVYRAETQLMGLGVIEETPESIAIRCSVDPEDFTLNNLLQRLENTGSTMRGEAIKALAHGDTDLAQRALNRERQANKIFVLLLRLIFTSYQNPTLTQAVGLDSGFPLIGYRSVAKNLELTADNAEDIAEIALETDGESLAVEQSTMRRIREFTDQVDELTELAVRSVVERDYDLTVECRRLFRDISDRESEILDDLSEMDNEDLLRVREVLVSLQHTAEYAMRNAEIAANLALNEESEHVKIE